MLKDLARRRVKDAEAFFRTDLVYVFKGSFWLTLANVVGALASFITLIFFSRLLEPELFGTYRYVLSYISILSLFSLPGLNAALLQSVARGLDGGILRVLKLKLLWGTLSTLAGLGVASYYAYNDNYVLAGSFAVMALALPFMNAFFLFKSMMIGRKDFRAAGLSETITRVVSATVMIGTIFVTSNIILIIAAYFVHYILLRLLFFILTYRKRTATPEDPRTISYGAHLTVMSVVGTVASQIDKILVFHYLGAAQLAVYAVASAPIEQIRGLLGNLEAIATPKLVKREDDDIKQTLPRKMRLLELVLVPLVIVYVLSAPYIFIFAFPDYTEAIVYSQVLAIALLFFPRALVTAALSAKMKTKSLYIVRVVGPVVKIVLLLVLVSNYGLWGAVASVILSEALLYLIYSISLKRM